MTTWEPEDEAEWQRKQMTTHHEAPTLDEQIAIMQSVVDGAKEFPECFRVSDAAILASLERLRAIENAKGMPEEPAKIRVVNITENGNKTEIIEHVLAADYYALRLHAQHLQDRLNRIEALMAGLLDTYASVLSPQMCAEIDAALLAKVEGRE